MSSEITLMCRQVESTDVVQNGVYNTTLDRPVMLEAGDTVSIKSATLNVVGDTIIIPEGGLNVELQGLKYLVNYNINRYYNYRAGNSISDGIVAPLMTYGNAAGTTPSGSAATGDNELYWLANAHSDSGAHTPYFLLNIAVVPSSKGRGGKRYGGGDLLIRYTDPSTPDQILKTKATIHIASYQEDRFQKHNPIPLPEDDRKQFPTRFYQIKCASIGGVASIEVDPDMFLPGLNIASVSFPEDTIAAPIQPVTPLVNSYEINPQVFSWTATIPEGDYTPIEMAAQLTDILAPIEHNGATSANYDSPASGGTGLWDPDNWTPPSATPFLETVLQNEKTLAARTAANAGTDNKMCFTNASRPVSFTDTTLADNAGTVIQKFELDAMIADYDSTTTPYTPPVDRWIGTDSLSLSFDEDENKMKIDIAHFPIYVNSTGATAGDLSADAKPGVQYNQLNPNNSDTNGFSGLAKAYSGVAFTAMSPPSFWADQLGFSNNTVVVNPNSAVGNFPNDAGGTQNTFTVSNVIPGQTITEGFAGLSVPVVTSSDRQYPPGTASGGGAGIDPQPGLFAEPIHSAAGNGTGTQVTTADTVAIFGGKTFNQQIQSAGYFLIDVANNFQTDFVGSRVATQTSTTPTTGQDTMSIVSRYYTSNNYLTNQGPGNIVYTHPEGAKPQLLTDLSIRIKNPNGSFVSETILGRENTVFVSIDRSPRPVNVPPTDSPSKSRQE